MWGVGCDVRRREGCGVAVWNVDIGAVYPHHQVNANIIRSQFILFLMIN